MVGVGPVLQQQRRHRHVVHDDGSIQRCLARRGIVDICSVRQEYPGQVEVAVGGRKVQRRIVELQRERGLTHLRLAPLFAWERRPDERWIGLKQPPDG